MMKPNHITFEKLFIYSIFDRKVLSFTEKSIADGFDEGVSSPLLFFVDCEKMKVFSLNE